MSQFSLGISNREGSMRMGEVIMLSMFILTVAFMGGVEDGEVGSVSSHSFCGM